MGEFRLRVSEIRPRTVGCGKPASHVFCLQVGAQSQSSPGCFSGLCCGHPLSYFHINHSKSDGKKLTEDLKDVIHSPWSRETRKKRIVSGCLLERTLQHPGACCRDVREGDSLKKEPLWLCTSLRGRSLSTRAFGLLGDSWFSYLVKRQTLWGKCNAAHTG